MDPLWTLYRRPMDRLWTPYGPPMDPLWAPYGPPMDPIWSPYGPPSGPQVFSLATAPAGADVYFTIVSLSLTWSLLWIPILGPLSRTPYGPIWPSL